MGRNGGKTTMTVGELIDALEERHRDEEVFLQGMNVNDEPIYRLVSQVTLGFQGVLIHAGEDVVFEKEEEQP
jgi:hypothetical protein